MVALRSVILNKDDSKMTRKIFIEKAPHGIKVFVLQVIDTNRKAVTGAHKQCTSSLVGLVLTKSHVFY